MSGGMPPFVILPWPPVKGRLPQSRYQYCDIRGRFFSLLLHRSGALHQLRWIWHGRRTSSVLHAKCHVVPLWRCELRECLHKLLPCPCSPLVKPLGRHVQ